MRRDDAIKAAKKAGATVWEGGSHTRMSHPKANGEVMQIGRHREIYGHQESVVRKWLIKIGALLILFIIMDSMTHGWLSYTIYQVLFVGIQQ